MLCSSLPVPTSSSTSFTVDLFFENDCSEKVTAVRVEDDGEWKDIQEISPTGTWHSSSKAGFVWLMVLASDDSQRRLLNNECYIELPSTSPFTLVAGEDDHI